MLSGCTFCDFCLVPGLAIFAHCRLEVLDDMVFWKIQVIVIAHMVYAINKLHKRHACLLMRQCLHGGLKVAIIVPILCAA